MWRKSIIVGKFFPQNKKKWEMKIAPVYYQLCKTTSAKWVFFKKLFILRKFVKKIQLFVKNVN